MFRPVACNWSRRYGAIAAATPRPLAGPDLWAMASDGAAVETRPNGQSLGGSPRPRQRCPSPSGGRPVRARARHPCARRRPRRQCTRRVRVDGDRAIRRRACVGCFGRRLVDPRRIPRQPAADEPRRPQPRAHRRGAPVQCLAAGRRLRGRAGRAQPPGDPDQPRRGQDVADGRRPPARRRQPPDGGLGPGPRHGTARLYYTAMGGPAPNYHFIVSYSDNEGRTWHQGFVADSTRGWSIGIEDLVVDTNPVEPQLRRRLPRVQLAEGPGRRRRPPRRRIGRLRPHVRRDRDPEGARAPGLSATPGASGTSSRPRRTGRPSSRATSST